MPEYLDDPSVLTKDKLKSELLAHNVELPSGNPTKDVYVQLYLNNLTAQNNKHVTAATLDAFSSDEELPPPVVSNRSRSSGRKATRKTDKVLPDELDVTVLTDQDLKDELLKHGVEAGPIVASTRKLYEKKLQKLLDDGPTQPLPQLVLTDIQVNHNGNSESDLYSDKEDEVTAAPEPEPVAEPEPVPVVERPLRSRGKTPITTRTRSSQHHARDQLMDEDDDDEEPVLQVKRRSRRSSHRAVNTVPPPPLPPHTSTEPEASIEPLRPAARSLPEERSPRPVARLSGPTRVDPLTFSPMCNISPIKRQESHWSLSDQLESKPGGVSAAGVEKIAANEQPLKVEENEVLKELFPNDINSPTGITATCRRPIRGAAGRPLKSSDLWNDENSLFSPKTTKTSSSSSHTETRTINRVNSLPPSASFNSSTSTSSFSTSSSSRHLAAAPPAGQAAAAHRSVSPWIKLFLLAIVAAFLFLVYQAMETNPSVPFGGSGTDVASDNTA